MIKFAFVFPYNTFGGAFKSTYSLANELIELGHAVDIIFPYIQPNMSLHLNKLEIVKQIIHDLSRSILRGKNIPFHSKFEVRLIPVITENFINGYDVVVANHWQTFEPVFKVRNANKLVLGYIRDVEQWSNYFNAELNAFSSPMLKIAVSQFVRDMLDFYDVKIDAVINNGIYPHLYQASRVNRLKNKKITIGYYYAEHPMKGGITAARVLSQIKQEFPEVNIKVFGASKPHMFNFDYDFEGKLYGEELKHFYVNNDIFLSCSTQEGFGNTPIEAMCSGSAVVTTNVGAFVGNANLSKAAIVCAADDVESLVSGMRQVIINENKRKELGLMAAEVVDSLSWQQAALEFLNVVKKYGDFHCLEV